MSVSQCDAVLAGRYRLEAKIATGGMGEVWRGRDTVLGRPVAVKLMREEFAGDPDTLTRFRDEARHSAALSHPGIAHVYDYGENGPERSPFIVMELVNGPSLTELLTHGPLEPARVMGVVAQAATALAAAHSAGLVHRDIKPGNILIAPGNIVKITDFGIAYAAGSAPLTRTGAVIGTPAYVAPERLAGSPGTPASDLYGLGVVAYECLAGKLPFSGSAVNVTLEYARRGLPALPASVPRPVAELIARLTARDPAARPASAAEVAAWAIQLQGAPPSAAPPSAAQPSAAQEAAAHQLAAPALPAQRQGSRPVAELPYRPYPGPAEPVTGWAVTPGGSGADTQPPTLLDVSATVTDAAQYADGGPRRAGSGNAGRRRHPALLAAAVAAVIAALGGWLLAHETSGTRAPAPASSGHRAPASAPAVTTVNVDGPALSGLPAQQAARQLRALGLKVQLVPVPAQGQEPGTVVAVDPSGQVQLGSTVVLQTAVSAHHHHGTGDSGLSARDSR